MNAESRDHWPVIHGLVTSVTKWGPQTLYLAGGGLAGKRDIPASKEVYLQTTALTMNSRVIASGYIFPARSAVDHPAGCRQSPLTHIRAVFSEICYSSTDVGGAATHKVMQRHKLEQETRILSQKPRA